jgi:ATP/maltotriose-dependent transcriptional regulator MalT
VSVAPALVGRARELEGLRARLVDARRLGQIALLEGEAGIGKSRLIDEVLDCARDDGYRVLYGKAEELERTRPFRALADALPADDPDVAPVAAMLKAVLTPDGPSPFLVADAVLDLLEELSMRSPVVLALDDLQWADPETLVVLGAAGRLAYAPVFVVGALRPTPRTHELDLVLARLRQDGAAHLVLEPLDSLSVSQLVAAALGGRPGAALLHEVAGAGGNPFFVLELLHALREDGAIEAAAGGVELTRPGLVPAMRFTVVRRLAALQRETVEALRAASVLGSSFSLADLSAFTGRTAVALAGALDDAVRAGVLGAQGDRLAFRHDLVRESLYADMPEAVRKAMHRDAGRALAAAGRPALDVATHMGLGAQAGDMDAVEWLVRAMTELRNSAHPTRLELCRRAHELTPPSHPLHDQTAAYMVQDLAYVGRAREAEELARQLLARPLDRVAEGAARLGLAEALESQGRIREALEAWEELNRLNTTEPACGAEPAISSFWHVGLADSTASLGFGALMFGEIDQAERHACAALDLAGPDGSRIAISNAHAILALVASVRGHVDEGLDHARSAVSAIDELWTRRERMTQARMAQGGLLAHAGRLDEAIDAFRTGYERLAEVGRPGAHYHWSIAATRYLTGAWDDALAEVETGFADVQSPAHPASLLGRGAAARILLHRGDIEGAERWVRDGEQVMAEQGPGIGWEWILWCRALLHEARGETEAARSMLEALWQLAARLRYFAGFYRLYAPDVVRLAGAGVAEAVTAEVEEGGRRSRVASAVAVGERCRGLVSGDADALRRAVDGYRRAAGVIELAYALEDAGDVELLEEALRIWDGLGAVRDAARVEAALRARGVRRVRRVVRARATTGWDALTRSEREVVALVAEGLTNPQIAGRLFVSRNTVRSHLAHVFDKLGCASRAELAAEAVRRAGAARAL